MTLTERLAEYVLARTQEQIGPEIWARAKKFFMDGLGCAVAGADEDAVRIVRESRRIVSGHPTATLIASKGEKTDAESAAMINGTAVHVHDFDDGTTAMRGHPTCVVLPAVLACAEENNASGKQVLEAYIAGIEICGLLGRGLNPAHYTRGWHNTSTIGIFGATAAAGKLMNLDQRQMVSAFGIAASESSGLKGNFGTMCKPFHAGRAAAKGILSARLAKLGFESSPTILEEGHGNFPEVTTGGMDRAKIIELLATEPSCFLIPGLDFKVYPSCGASHNGIDAIMELKKEQNLQPEDVRHIRCRVQPVTRDLLRYERPATPLQGKFSLQYCLALALLQPQITLDDFEGSHIADPHLLNLMEKIEVVTDDSIAEGAYFRKDFRWDIIVEVETVSGDVLVKRVEYAQGDPHLTAAPGIMEEKFINCTRRVINAPQAREVIMLIQRLETLDNITSLMKAVSPK